VVFHVDYWDYLGWKDPYSQKAYSDRQRTYARRWKASSVYTPMFVLDGAEWKRRNEATLVRPGPKVGTLEVASLGNLTFRLRFSPVQAADKGLLLSGALLGSDFITDVKSGENGGRKLAHDF